jgi:hypothetical protein
MKKIKESLTMKKVVDLSERRREIMDEDELLVDTIERIITQVNQLVVVTSQVLRRITEIEQRLSSSSSAPLLSDEED